MMKIFHDHPQWKAVSIVCKTLQAKGFTAYLAGGCVRDLLLNQKPKDFDVATSATPDQVAHMFSKTVNVGKIFGVIRVIIEDQMIEVATFRKDGDYKDGRRPDSVTFSEPKEDALRRDFTANALFYDISENKIIDYVRGEEDIKNKILRAVGDPEKRFDEDKLRLLRAFRFKAQLGFEWESSTAKSIQKRLYQISWVTKERIQDEWQKLLRSEFVGKSLSEMAEYNFFDYVFREWKEDKIGGYLWQKLISSFPVAEKDQDLVWLLWYMPQIEMYPDIELFQINLEKILNQWRLAKQFNSKFLFIHQNIKYLLKPDHFRDWQVAKVLGHPQVEYLKRVLIYWQRDLYPSLEKEWNKIQSIYFVEGKLPQPLIDGKKLLRLGYKPGPQIGEIIEKCFEVQLSKKITDKKEIELWVTHHWALPDESVL